MIFLAVLLVLLNVACIGSATCARMLNQNFWAEGIMFVTGNISILYMMLDR